MSLHFSLNILIEKLYSEALKSRSILIGLLSISVRNSTS